MRLLARGAAFGGLGVFLLGGVLLGCGVLIIRAAHDHLERS